MSKCFARLCCAMGLKTVPGDLMPDFYKTETSRSGLMGFQEFAKTVSKR